MMYGNDEQTKSVSLLLTSVTVLSLISSELAYDDNSWNEIHKFRNISESEFDQSDTMNHTKIGLFVFTQYCGSGERVWKSVTGRGPLPSSNTYADIDECCKRHDECPNYITGSSDYEKYIGLPHRPQLFARLECSCDAQLFSCFNTLNSQYANTVAFGYGVVQSQCFHFDYPIVGCNKYSNNLLPLRRCIEYRVDDTREKIWQWFDVPPASLKLYDFPRTTTSK